jgi:RNA polymerase sigma-70 factor (ECF subfamily)
VSNLDRVDGSGALDCEVGESSTAESVFADFRPRLFAIAYRRLGDVTEAEDIVQETWIRWQNCDRAAVRDPRAFLAAATARLSTNFVMSARARHETCIDTSLLESADATADPAVLTERGEEIELAMRLILETLTPSERAAYVLRHAFDYPYVRIAEIVEQTQASVRQHVSRARKRLTGQHRAAISTAQHQQLLDAFVAGAQDGDLIALEQLFAADIVQSREAEVVRAAVRPFEDTCATIAA